MGWSPTHIGIALSVGGVAGMLTQIPGGALADVVTWKRGLAAIGILATAVAALLFAISTSVVSVFIAQILQGVTAGIITPVIGAISLGLVGRSAMAGAHRPQSSLRGGRPRSDRRAYGRGRRLHRQERNLHGRGAAVHSGTDCAELHSRRRNRLCAGTQRQGCRTNPRQRNGRRGRARQANAKRTATRQAERKPEPADTASIFALAKNPALVLFIAATVLFQLADASVLPMIGENLATSRGGHAALWMSGLVVVPQVVVAALAPWVGFHSEKEGGDRCS